MPPCAMFLLDCLIEVG
ncbi:hypothetical protein OIU79_029544 [Salix purpurea]|uniref:Uncharacterized protein n=1 Tax=Salix purpurea TaxID=77065 RepID=A0A9Q0ZVH5_SALPP|nr:hypothetical protein OIU79_029544 [Salix purpurea]